MLNLIKKEKGFTLIELMIVVAIIGILAAIAIPQFASYRIKAFNSAATADLRNTMTDEEATFADSQSYTATPSAKSSKGVTLQAQATSNTYSLYTGHSSGDKIFGGDNLGTMRYSKLAAGSFADNAAVTAVTANPVGSAWGTGAL